MDLGAGTLSTASLLSEIRDGIDLRDALTVREWQAINSWADANISDSPEGAATLTEGYLDARRAKAVGAIARRDLALDLFIADEDTGEVIAESPGRRVELHVHVTDTAMAEAGEQAPGSRDGRCATSSTNGVGRAGRHHPTRRLLTTPPPHPALGTTRRGSAACSGAAKPVEDQARSFLKWTSASPAVGTPSHRKISA